MKKIAVVTGASSGIGKVFSLTAGDRMEFDELWAIARREDRLQELADKLAGKVKVVPQVLDLTEGESIQVLKQKLAREDVEVVLLINAAGFGKFQAVEDKCHLNISFDDTMDCTTEEYLLNFIPLGEIKVMCGMFFLYISENFSAREISFSEYFSSIA